MEAELWASGTSAANQKICPIDLWDFLVCRRRRRVRSRQAAWLRPSGDATNQSLAASPQKLPADTPKPERIQTSNQLAPVWLFSALGWGHGGTHVHGGGPAPT